MSTSTEKWYVKYTWIIFFAVGLLNVMAAPINLHGNPPNPPSPEAMTGLTLAEMGAQIPGLLGYISSISVQLGNFLLLTGVLIMGIAAMPFKKGERWAWYVFWILPVFVLIQLGNSRGGFLWQADAAFLVVILAGLLLSYRKFFTKERETS